MVADTLYRCFPGGELWEGEYFDRYSLESSVSTNPSCLPVRLKIGVQDKDGNTPFPTVTWSLSNGTASSVSLLCDRGRDDVFRVEAEDLTKGAGWKENIAFVEGWTGRGYLADNFGSQDTSYSFDLFASQQVYGWVRYYKRQEDNFPAYMNLSEQSFPFADVPPERLNSWIWERVGPFDLDEWDHRWTISRPYDGQPEKFMALFIDSVIFTTDPSFSPEHDSAWHPTIDSEYNLSKNYDQGAIVLELPPGQYRCRISVESDLPLVDSHGNSPVQSDAIEIVILH